MSRRIEVSIEERTAVVRMDDGKANAMQQAWCGDLSAALDEAEQADVVAVVLLGRPGFFSGGLDLALLPTLAPEDVRKTTGVFLETMRRVFLFPRPVIAASGGHAIAGGMMLYLAADVRLALDDPRFRYGLNEATNGIPFLGGTAGICQYAIPRRHHTELLLHGRLVDAAGACARGITDELCDDARALQERAIERARELADVEPSAYALNKRLLREPWWDAAVAEAGRRMDEAPRANVFAAIRRD